MAISVVSAAHAAVNHLQQFGHLVGDSVEDIRLEEVELSEDEKHWFVTLGYSVPVKTTAPENRLLGSTLTDTILRYERVYKVFKVDVEQGAVQSMKIREV